MPLVEINLRIGTRQEDSNLWVGWCPSIDVASVGETQAQAREAVKEAIGLWLDTCGELGTLDEALQEVGFIVAAQDEVTSANRKLDFVKIGACSYVKSADYLADEANSGDISSDFSDFAYQHLLEAPA